MTQPRPKLSRRTVFVGAGTFGALAVTTQMMRGAPVPVQAVVQAKEPPLAGGGYSLSEHVQRYYKTTLV